MLNKSSELKKNFSFNFIKKSAFILIPGIFTFSIYYHYLKNNPQYLRNFTDKFLHDEKNFNSKVKIFFYLKKRLII